jgi:hypothetical protein
LTAQARKNLISGRVSNFSSAKPTSQKYSVSSMATELAWKAISVEGLQGRGVDFWRPEKRKLLFLSPPR